MEQIKEKIAKLTLYQHCYNEYDFEENMPSYEEMEECWEEHNLADLQGTYLKWAEVILSLTLRRGGWSV